MSGRRLDPPSPERAAEMLAEIAKHELGVEIAPEKILKLFEKRWRTLSDMAHAIHEPIARAERERCRAQDDWSQYNQRNQTRY